MAAYATQADFEAYVEGWVTTNAVVLERILERATRDIDRVLGPLPRYLDSGLKVDPTELVDWEAAALARATCAQAYHRILKGEGLDAGSAPDTRKPTAVKGPDFEETFQAAPDGGLYDVDVAGGLSPLVATELEPLSRFLVTGARARAT